MANRLAESKTIRVESTAAKMDLAMPPNRPSCRRTGILPYSARIFAHQLKGRGAKTAIRETVKLQVPRHVLIHAVGWPWSRLFPARFGGLDPR
jgi:hypothetical protein